MVTVFMRRLFLPLVCTLVLLAACSDIPVDSDSATVNLLTEENGGQVPPVKNVVRKARIYYTKPVPYSQQEDRDLAIDSYTADVTVVKGKPTSISLLFTGRIPQPLWWSWMSVRIDKLMLDKNCKGSQDLEHDPRAERPGLILAGQPGSKEDAFVITNEPYPAQVTCELSTSGEHVICLTISGPVLALLPQGPVRWPRVNSIVLEIEY